MDIRQIDKTLFLVHKGKGLTCAVTHPINIEQEKELVFKDRYYNPRLRYNHPKELNLYERKLQSIKTDLSPLGNLFREKKIEIQKEINLLKAIGTPSFTKASIALYSIPSSFLVRESKRILDQPREEKTVLKSSNISTIKNFLEAIIHFGFNWEVKQKEMIVGASFNTAKKIVYLNKHRTFTDEDVKRLIVHELGTHIMRAENAKKQNLNLYLIGFPNYLETEEGLAIYNEKRAGLLSDEILRNYAGRVIAVHLALKNSFSTVYNYLLEFFPRETAFTLTLRAKRGLADTSKPGAFTKDHLYLKGKYKVEDFVRKGGNIKDLYVGKIGTEHVDIVKRL